MKKEQVYIIGDIHGCFETLKALIKQLPDNARIILVGDLIDRGLYSKEVIQYVIDNNIECVRGNHEVMFLESFPNLKNITQPDEIPLSIFKNNGGTKTLLNYKDDEETLKTHLKFLNSLPYYIYLEDVKDDNGRPLLITHSSGSAYIKDLQNKNLDPIEKENMYNNIVWTRALPKSDNGVFNIFGHTIISYMSERYYKYDKVSIKEPIIEYEEGWADIDTGCCYNSFVYGYTLTALSFPALKVYSQENIDCMS